MRYTDLSELNNICTKLILSLKQVNGVGNVSIIKAFNRLNLNDPKDVDTSFSFLEKLKIPSLNKKINAKEFNSDNWNDILQRSDTEMQLSAKKNIKILNFLSDDYPKNLKLVDDNKFPVILYVKGNVEILNSKKSVAIIGTRTPSNLGMTLTKKYAKYFVDQEYTTISGLALGTDTNTHVQTIAAGGKTIAILAAGLDQPIYPPQNTELAHQILITGGALVSEYPFDERLHPQYLAARDVWQSGMADGVIAVETGIKGGTNIAMRHCKNQKRPLAVPDMQKYLNTDYLPEKSQGTQKFIDNKLAYPLSTMQSVIDFKNLMIKNHNQRMDRHLNCRNLPTKYCQH